MIALVMGVSLEQTLERLSNLQHLSARESPRYRCTNANLAVPDGIAGNAGCGGISRLSLRLRRRDEMDERGPLFRTAFDSLP
jgi:hypothetical protein